MYIAVADLPAVRGKYRENVSLSGMSWFGVGGKADVVFVPEDLDDLTSFLAYKSPVIPTYVIGVGSNILIRDGGFRGVIIRLGRGFNYIEMIQAYDQVVAGAAVLDINLSRYALDNGIGGLEFFSGIPGTIGGALAMNAGAYGNDVASVFVRATMINMVTATVRVVEANEMKYKYRGHLLGEDWLFVEGVFQGRAENQSVIQDKMTYIQEHRSKTQPIKSKTCGSTFKNHDTYKAWELIEQAKCRGLKVGGAEVSNLHCNFLINANNATADDLEELIKMIQGRVYEFSGVNLQTEIKIIGEYL
ncbi:UDP-N-acetylmuramate dehydrogenase [Rickettsiales endosymbiont of Peranema trichophorum]|uniref:UDP-N-acetylmuramate dehydrogenase n=1 Tax=Rickettsiales endosymbiont of Peranema trichophorum TaxID=2486577 RepID=UPI001023145C|nr:UDP-N-acetylmuramate dehydrogenase [Rickettsiales endosymbiont of Peranema trichophorum]RZI46715.1 UDP-N-acetylmuramate dehydrogenase [Rickettsiales endosymbiont of Peranema trichophorum]